MKPNLVKEFLFLHQFQHLGTSLLIRSDRKLPIKAYYVFAEANYISCGLGKVMVFLKLFYHAETTNATVTITSDKKALIFKCDKFENPIFIGRF